MMLDLKDRMWNVNFSPPGCPDFVKYLSQKVKNFRFQRWKLVVLENEEGPSYAGIIDKDTTEIDFANRKSQRSQPVVDEVIVPAPISQTQEVIVPYKSFEELPKGLRDELLKYSKPNQSSASTDILSDLQRQYFVYYMRSKDAKNDTPAVAARKLYDVGLKDRMRNVNFHLLAAQTL